MRPRQPRHSWRLVGAPGAAPPEDVVEAVLSRSHATLVYGESCFEVTTAVEAGGLCVLRLVMSAAWPRRGAGRRCSSSRAATTSTSRAVAPCRDALDGSALCDGDREVLRATLGALLDDAAHAMDAAERSP